MKLILLRQITLGLANTRKTLKRLFVSFRVLVGNKFECD